ncbi:hypothetical protein D3C77_576210 [compost metagenome]
MVLSGPVQAFTQPAGLAQLDGLILRMAGQGDAEGTQEVLVADDAGAPAGLGGGECFDARIGDAVGTLAAETVDLAQVDAGQRLTVFLNQPAQRSVRARLVFLYRTRKCTARQLQQALQAGAVIPENARLRLVKRRERQVQPTRTLQRLMAGLCA